jgi:prevent-host-death family protein
VDEIGAYDAKTHLPRLLDEVAAGKSLTITKHGHPVARLVPVSADSGDPAATIAALRSARQGRRRGRLSVRKMIDEGRS